MSDSDAELELKKRARRRLVGAVALALLAAIVLPMVMDQTPPASVQPVELRIPGQEQTAAQPVVAAPVAPKAAPAPAPVPREPEPAERSEPAKPAPASAADAGKEVAAKPLPGKDAAPRDSTAKAPAKELAAPVLAPAAGGGKDPTSKEGARKEAERARAILGGQMAASGGGDAHVILIGAFSNPGNVKTLQSKLGELGIKVYTEKLASPQGDKTRVRAGPFASRDAAEKALARMKRIGVGGIVAPQP